MDQARGYDVFLSYNSLDRAAAEGVARWLVEAGLNPFFDRWELVAGELWLPALEEALGRSRTCAILIGPHGPSPWLRQEMQAALVERARNPQFRVIPVLLPGTQGRSEDLLPRFLQLSNWVELRDGLGGLEGLHALAAGIRGTKPGRWSSPSESDCPYRGLRVFEEEHSRFFFGREEATRWLIEVVGTHRFVAVVGPSGSGKSSLARAGLVSELRRGGLPGSEGWPLVVFRPGRRPLEQMALAFTQVLGPRNDLQAPLRLMDQLAADRRQLHFAARMVLGNPEARVLLVIDQFEEVFTLCHAEEERRSFLDALLHATEVEDGPVSVVLTLRADFYGLCATRSDLAERITERQMLVGPMSQEELRNAIERPARMGGMELDPGLVETILEDVREEPGSLPLLQHALLELWNQREGHRLTFAAYRRIGGVRGAIAHRAETVFAGFEEARKAHARRILLRLTQPGEGTEDTRRRVSLAELLPVAGGGEEVEATLHALVQARLVTTGTDERGEVTVDIAHEALIRHWGRFRSWIEEDRDALRTHRRLIEAAEEWERSGRDESYLYAGARLAGAEEWSGGHGESLSRLERDFLDTSRLRHEREQERELAHTQALLEAERQRARESERLRLNALALALALQASQRALNPIEQGELTALLALQAYHFNRETQGYALGQVDRALRLGLSLPQFGSEVPATNCFAFSPDSRLLACGDAEGVKLWDLRSFQPVFQLLRGEQEPAPRTVFSWPAGAGLQNLAFSPDGRLLAALEDPGNVVVWDVSSPEHPRAALDASPFLTVFIDQPAHQNRPRFPPLCFTPDSRTLVLPAKDGSIRFWDLERAQEPPRILIGGEPPSSPYAVTPLLFSLRFRPDGLLVLLTGAVKVYDLERPFRALQVCSLQQWSGVSSFIRSSSGGAVNHSSAAISPDGTMVAEGVNPFYGYPPQVRLWRLGSSPEGSIPRLSLRDDTDQVRVIDVALSPGDRFLAASLWKSSQGIKLWHLERPASPPLRLSGSGKLAFSPDGRTLASRGNLWNVGRTDPTSAVVLRLAGPVGGLAFDAEGTMLAVSTQDSLQVHDLRRPEAEPLVFDVGAARPAFSRNGRRLAAVRQGDLLVWDLLQPEAPPLSLRSTLSGVVERPYFDFLGVSFEEDERLTWFDQVSSASHGVRDVCWTRLDLTPWAPDRLAKVLLKKTDGEVLLAHRNGASFALLALSEHLTPGLAMASGEPLTVTPHLWSITTAGENPVCFRQASGKFKSFAVTDAGKKLAAGGENRTVTLWDAGRPEAEPVLLSAYQDVLLTLAFNPDGTVLAGGGDGAIVQLWDLRQPLASPAILEGHQAAVLAATFSPDGRFLATGDEEGVVRIWIACTDTLAELLRSRVGREMTDAEWRQFVGQEIPRGSGQPSEPAA